MDIFCWQQSTLTSVSHKFEYISSFLHIALVLLPSASFTLLFTNAVVLGFVTVVGLCSLTFATTFDRRDNYPRNDPSITRRIYLVAIWWIVQMDRVNGSAYRRNYKDDIFTLRVNINQSAWKKCFANVIESIYKFRIWEARRDVSHRILGRKNFKPEINSPSTKIC